MYVVRFSNDIQWDIERGYSCWGDLSVRRNDQEMSEWDYLDDAEAVQARWIFSYGARFEDFEVFKAEWIEENAAKNAAAMELEWVRDEKYGTWAPFHHDGLSCFALTATDAAAAVAEYCDPIFVADPTLGDRTIGAVEYVRSFECHGMTFHLLQCESAEAEEWLHE